MGIVRGLLQGDAFALSFPERMSITEMLRSQHKHY